MIILGQSVLDARTGKTFGTLVDRGVDGEGTSLLMVYTPLGKYAIFPEDACVIDEPDMQFDIALARGNVC